MEPPYHPDDIDQEKKKIAEIAARVAGANDYFIKEKDSRIYYYGTSTFRSIILDFTVLSICLNIILLSKLLNFVIIVPIVLTAILLGIYYYFWEFRRNFSIVYSKNVSSVESKFTNDDY